MGRSGQGSRQSSLQNMHGHIEQSTDIKVVYMAEREQDARTVELRGAVSREGVVVEVIEIVAVRCVKQVLS